MSRGRKPVCRVHADETEDAILRMEVVHRVTGEIAAALAALHLAAAARTKSGRKRTLLQAVARLEAMGRCVALIDNSHSGHCNLHRETKQLVRAMWAGHVFPDPARCDIDLERLNVDRSTGQRILLIAAELIGNAIRHGIQQGGSTLGVVLRKCEDSVVLVVLDDGPGFSPQRPFGACQGIRIADELAYRVGGRLHFTSDNRGSSVAVELPFCPTIGGEPAD